MPDGSHHGEGEHDERDVAVPAVRGPDFVVVEAAYQQASNFGLSTTETRYPQLNKRADVLIQAMVDRTDGAI